MLEEANSRRVEESRGPGIRRFLPVLALIALCAALYFWRLGMTPLDDFDEAYYAEGAREMLQRGDFGTPYYNGQPFLLKPILIYWLIAGAFRLLGTTEFAARSVSAFFAAVIVLETYWFAAQTLGRRTGLLAGVILALSYLWVDTGREAMTDMPLTAALAPAMFLLFLGTRASPGQKRLFYLSAYPLLGIALLAKGPVGLVSIVGYAGYLIWSRRLGSTLREAYVLPGLALLLAVAAPWYTYESIKQPAFLGTFLLREHFGHLRGDLARNDAWWGHLKNLVVGFFPWVIFLPAAALHVLRHESQQEHEVATRMSFLRFCGWWAVTVVVIFSLAGAKLPHYLVPTFPPMAILVAAWFEERARSFEPGEPYPLPPLRARRGGADENGIEPPRTQGEVRTAPASGTQAIAWILVAIGTIIGLVAAVALTSLPAVERLYAQRLGEWRPGSAPGIMLGVLALGCLIGGVVLWCKRTRLAFCALAVGIGAALFVHVGWFKPHLALIQSQPRKELAQFAGATLPPDEPLGVYKAKRNATIFYAQRPIVDLGEWEPEKLVVFLSSRSPATALTDVKSLEMVEQRLPSVYVWMQRGEFVLVSNHTVDGRD